MLELPATAIRRPHYMYWLLIKFELYPYKIFDNDKYSFLNMIGTKLSDQRNSKHAGRFKLTNYCGNFLWQTFRFVQQSSN